MATWTVEPYFKKSVEEHEHFYKDDQTIVRRTGWRWAQWIITTNDDNPPEFEFDYVPGGDGRRDSINMYDACANNIEDVEFVESWDGCWEDIDWPEDMDEDEIEALQERIDEEGFYDVIEEQEGWTQDDTEMWVWGPIAVKDNNDVIVHIVEADEDGNVTIKSEDDYN